MATYEQVHMPHINVMVVQAAERYGWTLVWRELTPTEIAATASEGEPGSDCACPIYGVHAIPPNQAEKCLLWWYPDPEPGGRVVRSETHVERMGEEDV